MSKNKQLNSALCKLRENAIEIERMRAELNAIWDALREEHVSYAERPMVQTIRELAQRVYAQQAEIKRLQRTTPHEPHRDLLSPA